MEWQSLPEPPTPEWLSTDTVKAHKKIAKEIRAILKARDELDAKAATLAGDPAAVDFSQAGQVRAEALALLQRELLLRQQIAAYFPLIEADRIAERAAAHDAYEDAMKQVSQQFVDMGYDLSRPAIEAATKQARMAHPSVRLAQLRKNAITSDSTDAARQPNEQAMDAIEAELHRAVQTATH